MYYQAATALPLFQHYHIGRLIVHVRHRHSDRRTNVSRVANHISAAIYHDVITFNILFKLHRRRKVSWIVDKHNVKSQQIPYNTGEEY